ncbi:MAG: hypothetical protein JXR14_02325 [Paracoccaceae bacterium]
MNSNFALDLSEDGIVLLHRATTEADWSPVASVSLDSETLSSDLDALRLTAEALEGEAFTTELILPESQLLYATVSIENDVESDVEAALVQRTPYAIEELCYDIDGTGPEVRIVAVARQTLREAEEFVAPYNLNAVAFTARPDPALFSRAPNLGTVEGALAAPAPESGTDAPASAGETPPDSPDTPPQDASPDDAQPDVAQKSAEPETTAPGSGFTTARKYSNAASAETAGTSLSDVQSRIALGRPDTPARPAPRKAIRPEKPSASIIVNAPNPVPVIPPPPTSAARPNADDPAQKPVARDPIAELAARQTTSGPPPVVLFLAFASLVAILIIGGYATGYLGGAPRQVELAAPAPDPDPPALPETATSQAGLRSVDAGAPDSVTIETAADPNPVNAKPELRTPARNQDMIAAPARPAPSSTTQDAALAPRDAQKQPGAEEALDLAASEFVGPMSATRAATAYVATGIWQKAPELSNGARPATLDGLYVASLDPSLAFEDPPALPVSPGRSDRLLNSITSPPPAGTAFDLDPRGLVRPTPDGALNANGIPIIAGQPPIAAIQRPEGLVVEQALPVDQRLAAFKPQPRPDGLIETRERTLFGGRTRSELAAIRPETRPENSRAFNEAIANAIAEASVQSALNSAVLGGLTSLKPAQRPANIERLAARAARNQGGTDINQAAGASTAALTRARGPAVARNSRANPTGPISASVARAATDNNAISLGSVALVGVFGTPFNRRALVRMPNGKFKKVSVGDRVDGGRVAAIGEAQLLYQKGGRTVTLNMPKG